MVEIVSSRYVPIPVAKAILEKLRSEGGESIEEENPVIAKVYDYLSRFSKCSAEQAEEAMKKLTGLGFSEFAAAMLVNLLPRDTEEARALLGNIDGGYEAEKVEEAVRVLGEVCGEEEAGETE